MLTVTIKPKKKEKRKVTVPTNHPYLPVHLLEMKKAIVFESIEIDCIYHRCDSTALSVSMDVDQISRFPIHSQ